MSHGEKVLDAQSVTRHSSTHNIWLSTWQIDRDVPSMTYYVEIDLAADGL